MGCYPHQKGRSTKNNENWSNWNRENHGNFTSKNQPWAFIISTTKHLHQQTQLAVVHHVAIWVDSAAHHAGTGISSVDEIHHLGVFVPWLTLRLLHSPQSYGKKQTWEMARRFSIWCWICKCFDDPTNHVSTNHNAASLSICLVWKFSAATSSKLHTQSPNILRLYLHISPSCCSHDISHSINISPSHILSARKIAWLCRWCIHPYGK